MTDETFFAQFKGITKYDYPDAVLESVEEVLEDDPEHFLDMTANDIIDELSNDDSVTGNTVGSFYCNHYKAMCCLFGNYSLVEEALEEFCMEPYGKGAEEFDVIARYYVLTSLCREKIEEVISAWQRRTKIEEENE